jgi:hypothetical protein
LSHLPTTLTDAIGTIGVLVRLLSEADEVLGTLDCEDTAEQEQMDQLRDAIMAATAPFLGRLETLKLLNQLKPPQPEERRRPLVQVAVQALNSVKAWRDSDGNEGFPHDTRLLIEAVLTAWELRQQEEAEAKPEPVAEVLQHPGWRTELVPLLVPLPGLKSLAIGTKLYAGRAPGEPMPLTHSQIQRGYMAAGTDSTNGPANWVEGIHFAERFHGISRPAIAVDETPGFDLVQHIQRQMRFSVNTFGPGMRTKGVCDHIRKELLEIEAAPGDLEEWIDVLILAIDGAWRSGATSEEIVEQLQAKQTKNEGRTWPDWRTADPDKAIEHRRGEQGDCNAVV